jgi:hypothetical protein
MKNYVLRGDSDKFVVIENYIVNKSIQKQAKILKNGKTLVITRNENTLH